MSEPSYQLTVPMGTSDESLIVALAGVLPEILVKRFHYPAEQARALAPALARAMVMRARECRQPIDLEDSAAKLADVAPTREQCEHLREDLDSIIKIRYTDPAAIADHRPGVLRQAVGRLWAILPKGRYYEQESTANASIGVRG
jgi:hypothetical protein